MAALWAARAPVACLHPAARALIGRSPVLESWKQILGGASRFKLRCDQPIAHVVGDTAIVTCYEGAGDQPAHLAATNVFVLEDGRWRMVHHHVGPGSIPVPAPPSPAFSVNSGAPTRHHRLGLLAVAASERKPPNCCAV